MRNLLLYLLVATVVLVSTHANSIHRADENGLPNVIWEDLSTYCFAETGTSIHRNEHNFVQRPPADCQDLLAAGQVFSGVYIVYR